MLGFMGNVRDGLGSRGEGPVVQKDLLSRESLEKMLGFPKGSSPVTSVSGQI